MQNGANKLLSESYMSKIKNADIKIKLPKASSISEQFMRADFNSYLPNDILVKTDRCSMAVGLESRAPFLDKRIVEFAYGLDLKYKISGFKGKIILRELLRKYISNKLIDKPKQGFTMPIGNWLRGPLKDWAEDKIFIK